MFVKYLRKSALCIVHDLVMMKYIYFFLLFFFLINDNRKYKKITSRHVRDFGILTTSDNPMLLDFKILGFFNILNFLSNKMYKTWM